MIVARSTAATIMRAPTVRTNSSQFIQGTVRGKVANIAAAAPLRSEFRRMSGNQSYQFRCSPTPPYASPRPILRHVMGAGPGNLLQNSMEGLADAML